MSFSSSKSQPAHSPIALLNYTPSRGSSGYASLIRPLLDLARQPSALLETFLEELRPLPSADTFTYQELEHERVLLYCRLEQAFTFDEWHDAATELDKLEDNNGWKNEEESSEYDHDLVRSRLEQLDDARMSCDTQRMMFLIRTSFTRYLGGMGNLRLYKHTHVGTKRLIERYIDSALETIAALVASSHKSGPSKPDARLVLDQVLLARQSFGRSALLLSGGGTFGMNHNGVVKSLWEARLLPRIVSGASAGSIVSAVLCTKTDDEIPSILDEFCYGDLEVFTTDKGEDTLLRQAARFLKYGALFDISNLIRVMKSLIGEMTFQEAYNRTRRILNICVSTASLYELPRLLNYVTAPNVIIWSAVAASCSVPLVFSPAALLAKDPRTGEAAPWNASPAGWIDGSVDNDLPMTRLAEMFNVNHFIVSQVNPHVVPFLVREEDGIGRDARTERNSSASDATWAQTFAAFAKDEALHRMHVLSELGVFPNFMTKMRSVLSQKYSGDITILPEVPYTDFVKVLQNPTTKFMQHSTVSGERATWPKLSRIRNHCAIELALDDAIQQLRARVAFSQSQVDLRSFASKTVPARASSDAGRGRHSRARQKRQRMQQKGSLDANDPGRNPQLSIEIPNSNRARTRQSPQRPLSSGNAVFANRKLSASFHFTADHGARSAHSTLGEDLGRTISHNSTSSQDQGEESDADDSPMVEQHGFTSGAWSFASRLFPHASQPATPQPAPPHAESSSYFNQTTGLPIMAATRSSTTLAYRSSWPAGSRSPSTTGGDALRSLSTSPQSSRRSSRVSLSGPTMMPEAGDRRRDESITSKSGSERRRRRTLSISGRI